MYMYVLVRIPTGPKLVAIITHTTEAKVQSANTGYTTDASSSVQHICNNVSQSRYCGKKLCFVK